MVNKKEGGDLFDMAKDGTKMPKDAGKMRIIPSVPNPHQRDDEPAGGFGSTTLHGAADNAPSGEGEIISATGHDIPQSVTSKPGGRGGTEGSEDIRRATGAFAEGAKGAKGDVADAER